MVVDFYCDSIDEVKVDVNWTADLIEFKEVIAQSDSILLRRWD